MRFTEKTDIDHDIVTYVLQAQYNESLTDEESVEIESLHDYIRKIKLSDIDFTANITVVSGKPVVVSDNEETTSVELSLGKISSKEYIMDENLRIEFSVDAKRISDSELNDVLNTKTLMSQARVAVFQSKIKEEIMAILKEIRSEDNDFEKELELIL